MQIGVSMYSYFRYVRTGAMTVGQFIREAHRAGADGVELLAPFYKDVEADRAEAIAALDETGLTCSIFSVSNDFAKESPEERTEALEKVKFGVDEAIRYRAGVVRVFAGDVKDGVSFDQAREWIVEGLAQASTYAHEKGVRLALENHGKLAGRGEQVREIICEVRSKSGTEALGANPDTGNFLLVDQTSHEAIHNVAPLAYMVHFKDFASEPEGHDGFAYESLTGRRYIGAAVGEGEVDLGRCIEELRKAGFNGWLSVEYEGEEDSLTAVPRSIFNARRYL